MAISWFKAETAGSQSGYAECDLLWRASQCTTHNGFVHAS